ncbi:pseudouridine synthase [Cryomyces antarcticus]|nr:pseudouridine synthase pus4 [Cryomyces antarcticus]
MSAKSYIFRSIMKDTGKILEGVFAIHKPQSTSSAQVLRDIQTHFNPSKAFAPYLERELRLRGSEPPNQKQKRSRRQRGPPQVKIGHGGTLDPLATGVLIAGIGKGTKDLQRFLECTKTYETVVLFGAETDTYDIVGKVVTRAPYSHVTKAKVADALGQYRGQTMQKPPIFSALKVDGKKMYEYAREGKELPIEIQARPVEVVELEMLEWMEGGTHGYHWPVEEAAGPEKAAAEMLLQATDNDALSVPNGSGQEALNVKRKRDEDTVPDFISDAKPTSKKQKSSSEHTEPMMSGALSSKAETELADQVQEFAPDASSTTKNPSTQPPDPTVTTSGAPPPASDTKAQSQSPSPPPAPCPAPAVRLSMTVTSGFYVRSLAHDLGLAVSSRGLMASLVRSRQGEFELGKNVLPYEDLTKGEDVWAPKVRGMLQQWETRTADDGWTPKPRGNAGAARRRGGRGGGGGEGRERRNSSSVER